jgi:hypothetical protein
MKKINFLLCLCCVLLLSCASQKTISSGTSTRDGSSIKKAIIVQNVPEEYRWIRQQYPGSTVHGQALIQQKRKYYDMLTVTTSDGRKLQVYFDINSFFGKIW